MINMWKIIFKKAKKNPELMKVIRNDLVHYDENNSDNVINEILLDLSDKYECCEFFKAYTPSPTHYYTENIENKYNISRSNFVNYMKSETCWCGKCKHLRNEIEIDEAKEYIHSVLPGCYNCSDVSRNISALYNSNDNYIKRFISYRIFKQIINSRLKDSNGKCWCNMCDYSNKSIYDCELEYMYEVFFWNNSERCLEMRMKTKDMSHLQLKNYYNSFGKELTKDVPFRVFKKFMNKSKCWCGKCVEGKDPYRGYMKITLSNEYDEQIRQYCKYR